MKKIMMVSLLLTAVITAQAQLKVAPKLEKGKVYTYESVATTSIAGQADFNITSTTEYTVAEETADGYIINSKTTDVKSDATADNMQAKLMSVGEELMRGLDMQVITDKEGRVKGIKNFEELKKKMETSAGQLVDALLNAAPQIAQMMPKETLMTQIMNSLNEESIVNACQASTSILALNGKTVMTGAQEEYVNAEGLKMKRMYFVNGRTVTMNESKNMTKDEMKALIISQVEKLMPQQAAMVKENIDKLMESGMMNIDSKGTATYELADDGWVNTIKTETTSSAMGQESKVTATVKRVASK